MKQVPRRPPDFVRGNHCFWWKELVYSGGANSGHGISVIDSELRWEVNGGRYVGIPGAQESYLQFIANEVLRED